MTTVSHGERKVQSTGEQDQLQEKTRPRKAVEGSDRAAGQRESTVREESGAQQERLELRGEKSAALCLPGQEVHHARQRHEADLVVSRHLDGDVAEKGAHEVAWFAIRVTDVSCRSFDV